MARNDDALDDGVDDAGATRTDDTDGAATDAATARTDDAATDAATARTDGASIQAMEIQKRTPVSESPVVMTASRLLTPFVVAFGVYITLFGTSLPGGAFQGGVIMGSMIVLLGAAFGFDPTTEWIDGRALAGLYVLGAVIFGSVAAGGVLLGGDVLELFVFPLSVENMVKLVEVAIAALVAGVITGLVVWLAGGVQKGGAEK